MALGNEIDALRQIEKEIDNLRGKLKGSHEDILAISKAAREAQGSFMDIKLPKELQKSLQANQTFLDQLNAQLKERERLEKALQTAIAKRSQAESSINKELLKHRLETNLINAAMRDEAVLSSKLVGAYQKLGVQHKNAAKNLRNIVAEGRKANESQRQFNRRLKEAQKEFDGYDKRIRKADAATRDFGRNVGNYQSALGKAGVAFRTFAGAFGVYSGLQIAREIYDQVKALDAADKALRQVTETTDNYNRANIFLKELAEESGTEIISLTGAYTKFIAASKTTNLTAEDTENIFRQVAKAGGVLGLSTETINGAFTALEQIMSKGKVQAEEIRGQLGERLPGAFQILAKSMGLTTQELDKQLELGNVLADDVLPKFADELERAYNLDLVDRVDTLAASQARLSNSWTEFLSSVESGEGLISNVFKDIFEGITNALNALTEFNKTFKDNQVEGEAKGVTTAIAAVREESEKLNISFKEAAERIIPRYKNIIADYGEELSKVTREQSQSIFKNFINVVTGEFDEQEKTAKRAGKQIALYGKAIETLEKIAESGKLPEEIKKVTTGTDGMGKSIERAREKLKELSEISFGTTIDEAKKLRKEAEDIAESLAGTKLGDGETVQFGIDALETLSTDEITNGLSELVKQHQKAQKEIVDNTKLSAEQQKEIFNDLFSTFSNYYGLDLTLFNDLIDKKKFKEIEFAGTLKSITNAIFESKLIAYENEIVANQERLDAILADETATEETKKQAKIEADRVEKEIRLKQAKAERNNVLVQIGIDTAAAVAKVLAQTGIAAPFVIPGIIALGAAQAAFVASQPLPKFKDGIENFDGGPAIINDQKGGNYKELVETPKGFFMTSKRNALVNLPKGSNVYSADDTRAILNSHQMSESERIDLAVMRMGFEMFGNLEEKIENGIDKGFKKARITNNIKNVIKQPTTRFF